jgi:hypothetical protein
MSPAIEVALRLAAILVLPGAGALLGAALPTDRARILAPLVGVAAAFTLMVTMHGPAAAEFVLWLLGTLILAAWSAIGSRIAFRPWTRR